MDRKGDSAMCNAPQTGADAVYLTPGWVAWQIWGGDAAKRWVDRIMEG